MKTWFLRSLAGEGCPARRCIPHECKVRREFFCTGKREEVCVCISMEVRLDPACFSGSTRQ